MSEAARRLRRLERKKPPGARKEAPSRTEDPRMTASQSKSNTAGLHAGGAWDLSWLRGKRVAVVVFSHYPSDPRPCRAAEAFARLGMKVEVLCLRRDDGESSREMVNGVVVRRISLKRRRGGKLSYVLQYSAFLLISFVVLTFRALTRRYHLVHVHNMPDVLVFAALVPKLFGAKVILDLHDPMPELMMTIYGLRPDSFGVRLLQRFERWSIRFADAVLTVNLACKRLFTARGCPPEKVRVVMNSPDAHIFERRNGQPKTLANGDLKPFVIMYHGSLVERHGLDIGVSALDMVKRSVPHRSLVGELRARTTRSQSPIQKSNCRYSGAAHAFDGAAAVAAAFPGVVGDPAGAVPGAAHPADAAYATASQAPRLTCAPSRRRARRPPGRA